MMHIGLDKSGQKSDIYHTARQERRKPKGEIQMKNKKYYIAYGSNLSVEQMADRCPDAKIAGQAVLAGWELLFRGCATIAPNRYYYKVLHDGYKAFRFPMHILEGALKECMDKDAAQRMIEEVQA